MNILLNKRLMITIAAIAVLTCLAFAIALTKATEGKAEPPANPCLQADFDDARCDIYDQLDSSQKDAVVATADSLASTPVGATPAGEESGGSAPTLEPAEPAEPPTLGLAEDLSAPPVPTSLFVPTNQWTGDVAGKLTTVWAGRSGADPRIGMLVLQIAQGNGEHRQLAITTPNLSGPLTIQGITNGVLNLTGTLAATLKFDLSGTKITL